MNDEVIIMHICVYLFTKNLPSDNDIDKILAPYNEHTEQDKCQELRWDSWTVSGRYSGLLKLKINENDEKYKWGFYVDQPRAGRLFRNQFIEHLIDFCKNTKKSMQYGFFGFNNTEAQFFNYSGFRDGYINVDGCKISELYNYDDVLTRGYGFIDIPFDQDMTRDRCEDYDSELKTAFERNRDNYVTILDFHF